MKKIFLSLGILATLFTACKKESADETSPTADPSAQKGVTGINAVPLTFTKKAFIENFTSATGNLCPEANAMVTNLITTYPNRVISIAVHENDKMSLPNVQNYHLRFNNSVTPNVPSYMVNRLPVGTNVFLTMQQLSANVTNTLNTPSTCGLAINSTLYGRTASISVHAGFNQTVSGPTNLTVYVIENNVTGSGNGYDQLNIYNTVSGSAFYNAGNPILGYHHQQVWRMQLTTDLGNTINPKQCVKAGHEIQNFSVDIPNTINLNEVYIVGIINHVGTNPTSHEVLNSQIAKLNTLKNWD